MIGKCEACGSGDMTLPAKVRIPKDGWHLKARQVTIGYYCRRDGRFTFLDRIHQETVHRVWIPLHDRLAIW